MTSRRAILPALLLAALTIAVFLPVSQNAFISFDDDLYLTDNPVVRQGLTLAGVRWAFTTSESGNWHPLTWLSHMTDVELFGMDPGRHHLVGSAIHVLTAVLLLLLLTVMTGALWRSLLVAALFAVHPLHVESVAWAAERKDLLSGLFWILACGAHLRYARRPGASRLALTCGLLALGLLAKPMLVTLPFALLLLDAWPLGRARLGWRRLVLEKTPLFLLAAVSSAVTFVVQREHGAFAGPLLAFADRCANSLFSYAAYLGSTFWPRDLAFFYPYRSDWSAGALVATALLLALVTGAAVLLARRVPALAVGWLWYLGTLVPVIGLVQVGGQAMADRYTYLPLIGIFVALAWLPVGGSRPVRGAAAVAAAGAVAVCALLARGQVLVWRDDFTLYRHAIAHTRGNYVARTNLGHALILAGRLEEAVASFAETSRVHPTEWRPHLGRSEALARLGRLAEAEADLRQGLELNAASFEGRNYLGLVLRRLGRAEEACGQFREALELKPDYADAAVNLGACALALSRPAEAERWFRRALEIRPDFPEAHHGLAAVLVRGGRVDEAIGHLREALRLRPDFAAARLNLEQALRLPRIGPGATP